MPRPPFPATLRQFQVEYATEEACQKYLARCRWPDGFVCPRCAHRHGYPLVGGRRWECAACGHQVSLTSGTVLHNTKTSLTLWFWAAYLMTTDKRGVSAFLLQRQLGLGCYETAWMILHKLRRAMVNLTREPLRGEVEIDDTWWVEPKRVSEEAANSRGVGRHSCVWQSRSGEKPRAVSGWLSSPTSKPTPSTVSSPRTWLPVRLFTPMDSRGSRAWKSAGGNPWPLPNPPWRWNSPPSHTLQEDPKGQRAFRVASPAWRSQSQHRPS